MMCPSEATHHSAQDPKYDATCWIRDCHGRQDFDNDGDTRVGGMNAQDLLKWRWLCSTGVYHAAGNTLSVEVTHTHTSLSDIDEVFP